MSGYIPNSDAERLIWINNFSRKLKVYAASVGISPAELTQLENDNAVFAYVMNMLAANKQSQQTITSYKNLLIHHSDNSPIGPLPVFPSFPVAPAAVPGGVFDRVRDMVQRIKGHPNYTEAMGRDLGVIAPENPVDIKTIMPVLSCKLDAGRPHLKWPRSVAQALDLYADHNDGKGFVYLGRFLRSEYIDLYPLAAGKIADEWKYKAMYVIGDEPVGLISQELTVVVLKQ